LVIPGTSVIKWRRVINNDAISVVKRRKIVWKFTIFRLIIIADSLATITEALQTEIDCKTVYNVDNRESGQLEACNLEEGFLSFVTSWKG